MKTFKRFTYFFVIAFFIGEIFSCNVAAGSYPYAQEYTVDVEESVLIDATNAQVGKMLTVFEFSKKKVN